MTVKDTTHCGICGKPVHPFASINYTDKARGLHNVNIHGACYRAHILKYFPDTRLAQWLVFNPTRYTEADEPQWDGAEKQAT